MNNIKTGEIGENIACDYLLSRGYLILARNHKEKFDEIDILARNPGGALVFCEVKTINKNNSGFMPEDNLSWAKKNKLIRSARVLLSRRPELIRDESGWQIDLLAITLEDERSYSIRHYENI